MNAKELVSEENLEFMLCLIHHENQSVKEEVAQLMLSRLPAEDEEEEESSKFLEVQKFKPD